MKWGLEMRKPWCLSPLVVRHHIDFAIVACRREFCIETEAPGRQKLEELKS